MPTASVAEKDFFKKNEDNSGAINKRDDGNATKEYENGVKTFKT